jgi:predicted membrane-bound mannosyltransferase
MKHFLSAVAASLLEARSRFLVLLLCAAWLAMLAGTRSLMLPDEGRYIGVAWAMLNSGDWLTPTLDGLPYFHKPPLFYWLTGLSLKLFGVNDWAGRLASVFGALVAVGGLFFFVRRYAEQRLATLAVAVLVTQPMFFAGAQYANLDTLVAGMISATIVCGASAILRLDSGQSYRPALAAAYVFAALGVLAKGLIGFVLPGAILLAWLLLRKRYRRCRAVVCLDADLVQRFLGLLFRLSPFPALLADRFQQRAALLVLRPGAAARRLAVVAVDHPRLLLEVPGGPGEGRDPQPDAGVDARHSCVLLAA